jgi:hypothetical protein
MKMADNHSIGSRHLGSNYATLRAKCATDSPITLCSEQAKGMRRRNFAEWLPLRQGRSNANYEP